MSAYARIRVPPERAFRPPANDALVSYVADTRRRAGDNGGNCARFLVGGVPTPPLPAGRDSRRMPEGLEVHRAVAASAGEIFAVLGDSQGHVAINSSGMLMEASWDIVAKVGEYRRRAHGPGSAQRLSPRALRHHR
jgi:hypothetical protein